MAAQVLTSESVTEGHPDKVSDFIADSVLDAYLELDPRSRVACEVLCKSGVAILAGEISSVAALDHLTIAREAIRACGYDDPNTPFNAAGVQVIQHISGQSWEIGRSVDPGTNKVGEQGAGDQGIVYGYATSETPERMPLTALLAHRLAQGLADDRRAGTVPWLRPDGKTQVSALYEDGRPVRVTDVLVSTQHAEGTSRDTVAEYVTRELAPRALGTWLDAGTRFIVNPSGSFVKGGPAADCGLTGRKIIVDTYGGAARHGGGAFSGKDPSKVDRSAAYAARWVAKNLVAAGAADKVEVQVAYAIGVAHPVSLLVETFGTENVDPAKIVHAVGEIFDLRPAAILRDLDLRRPIYKKTAAYGHFGRNDKEMTWEQTTRVDDVKSALGL